MKKKPVDYAGRDLIEKETHTFLVSSFRFWPSGFSLWAKLSVDDVKNIFVAVKHKPL